MAMLSPTGLIRRRVFSLLQYLALAVGLVAMPAMTVPDLSPDAYMLVSIALWCCLGIFACELAAKTWLRSKSPKTESHYLLSTEGIIDLLAVLPIPLALFVGIPPSGAWLLASLWILKLAVFVPGLSMLGRVLQQEARPLASGFVIFVIILMLASVALHVLEGAEQPKQFGSLPLSLWWAVTTLTSTGYGDAVPVTLGGRIIASIVMISGLGVFGLWTGILATGFAAEHRRRDFIRNWDLVTSVPFLKNLDPPAVIELTRMLRRIDLAEKTVVVRRGRPGDCMYFIASGEVEVKVEPHPVRLGAGAFFGEIALLAGGPRTATVTTTETTTLLMLEVSDFRAFTAHHPELAKAVEAEARRRAKHTAPKSHPLAEPELADSEKQD
jgi:voltage-gated potassium channel